jgi:hypothetical protein
MWRIPSRDDLATVDAGGVAVSESYKRIHLSWVIFWCVLGLGVLHNWSAAIVGALTTAATVALYPSSPRPKLLVTSGVLAAMAALTFTAEFAAFVPIGSPSRPQGKVPCGNVLIYALDQVGVTRPVSTNADAQQLAPEAISGFIGACHEIADRRTPFGAVFGVLSLFGAILVGLARRPARLRPIPSP